MLILARYEIPSTSANFHLLASPKQLSLDLFGLLSDLVSFKQDKGWGYTLFTKVDAVDLFVREQNSVIFVFKYSYFLDNNPTKG